MRLILISLLLLPGAGLEQGSLQRTTEYVSPARCEVLAKKEAAKEHLSMREIRNYLDWCLNRRGILID
jgi:hypothetical protein